MAVEDVEEVLRYGLLEDEDEGVISAV